MGLGLAGDEAFRLSSPGLAEDGLPPGEDFAVRTEVGKGLVRRMSDPNDRRRVIVEVTEELLRQVAPIYGPIAEEEIVFLNGYRTKDLGLLVDHFHTITGL